MTPTQEVDVMVSVVIPTYNRRALLCDRAIKSVQNQTFQNWECIVVDDGSTDDTETAVRAIAAADSRVRYVKKPNGGQASARNFGVRTAHGAYIAFTDDDDEFLPRYLETLLAQFVSLPSEVAYIGCDAVNRDEHGAETYSWIDDEPFWRHSIGGGQIFRCSVFARKELFFDEDKNMVGFEDLDLHLRFHEAGFHGYVVHEVLRIYYVSIRSKKSGAWSTNYERQRRGFQRFFEKNQTVYQAAGRDAMAWISLYGGFVFSRNGMAGDARRWFRRSFRLRPTLLAFVYITVSLFGGRALFAFDGFKNEAMRWIRSRITNRA